MKHYHTDFLDEPKPQPEFDEKEEEEDEPDGSKFSTSTAENALLEADPVPIELSISQRPFQRRKHVIFFVHFGTKLRFPPGDACEAGGEVHGGKNPSKRAQSVQMMTGRLVRFLVPESPHMNPSVRAKLRDLMEARETVEEFAFGL
nr:potassium transporter 8-like [Ipomoea batatas]GMD28223.1 potassium transporter 8-like [Ipomoea batatas]